jgi:hypothetical protein
MRDNLRARLVMGADEKLKKKSLRRVVEPICAKLSHA